MKQYSLKYLFLLYSIDLIPFSHTQVKEIQKGGKRRRKSSTQLSTESQDQGRGESPANIPDGACFLGDLDNEEEGVAVAMATSHDNNTRTQNMEYAPDNISPLLVCLALSIYPAA